MASFGRLQGQHVQRVVQLGQVPRIKLHVHHGPQDLGDAADMLALRFIGLPPQHPRRRRALLRQGVRAAHNLGNLGGDPRLPGPVEGEGQRSISSCALSEAFRMAVMRLANSLVLASSKAR